MKAAAIRSVRLPDEHHTALAAPYAWQGCGDAAYARDRSARLAEILARYRAKPWPTPRGVPPGSRAERRFAAHLSRRALADLRHAQRELRCSAREAVVRVLAGWLASSGGAA